VFLQLKRAFKTPGELSFIDRVQAQPPITSVEVCMVVSPGLHILPSTPCPEEKQVQADAV
jgi:hypothetical protein